MAKGVIALKILVSGSHGLVGTALIKVLSSKGHQVARLVRNVPTSDSDVQWHPEQGMIASEKMEDFEAVFHLAGESIASGQWTEEKKRRIRESRVIGTQLLAEAVAHLTHPPGVFVSASAIGIYGNRGDELLTEESSAGDDFLARVCIDWERSTAAAEEKGIRVVKPRFGIILAEEGGALAKMLPPFRMGIGGKIGSGHQWMSWIALDDVVSGLEFVLQRETISGPVNFAAPNPVTNATFAGTLGKSLGRPTFLPVPSFGARLAFGEMADALLLTSQKVEPKRLNESGFSFQYPDLKTALSHILGKRQ